jgi:hypothetical protein
MPPFGAKKARQPEASSEPAPLELPELSATERLNLLLAEQTELEAAIASHREERSRLMRESEAPSLGAVTAIATQTEQARIRLEWIAAQLPGIYAQLEAERVAQWEHAWQTHRPHLQAAQDRLVAAIAEFHAALINAHKTHAAAHGFGERVTNEFVRPPPPDYPTDWSLRQFMATVERRQRVVPAVQVIELSVETWPDVPAAERFRPKRVPIAEVEAISAIAPPRAIRVLHGPVRTANLNTGIARMFAGEEHIVSARAAHTLVESGCAEYLDAETAEAATAA